MRRLTRLLLTFSIILACNHLVRAEEGVLWVQVSNPQGRPIPGVVLSAAGPSSSSASTDAPKKAAEVAGKVRIRLASSTKPGDEVELIIVRSPQDLVFISPWHQRITVPCFEDNTRCVAKVVLAERGSRALLEYPPAQLAMAARVNAANAAAAVTPGLVEEQRRASLAEIAKAYGYAPEEIDRAIRELGKKAVDPYQLGQVALYERNYPEAERQLSRSKEGRRENLEKARGELADVIFSLGQTYYEQGRYKEAVKEYQEAATLRPDNGTILNSLGNALHRSGQYLEAEVYYLQALEIGEKALGSDHPDVAASLNNLALLYTDQGKYAVVEPLLKRALAIREMHLGPEHPDVAQSLNSLALLYKEQGMHADAEPLFKRALTIREMHLGPEHPDVAQSLNNLGGLYYARGRYDDAEPLYQRAISIWLKQAGPEHPHVATSLDNLATLYRAKGDYARAEPLYQRALSIFEKKLDPDHPLFATSLSNLALLYEAKGDYARAEPLFQRALSIFEKKLGSNHPSVAILLNNLAELYRAKGDLVNAVQYLSRGQEVREHNLSLILATGSQRQKVAYLSTLSGETYSTVSLHARSTPTDPQALELSLTTILRRKGRALDAMIDLVSLRRLLDPRDRTLLDQLSATQSQLAAFVLNGPGNMPPEEHRAVISRLEERAEQLQDVISRRSAEFKVQTQPITIEQVRQALPAGAALVEVFSYKPIDAKAKTPAERFGLPRYIAYVLDKEGKSLWVDLGTAASIDADVSRLLAALKCPPCGSVAEVKHLARTLDERVMRPVRKLLGDTHHIFLAPDGALNLVPFAALVDESGKYLVEHYSLSYLTSGRDLLRLQFNNESWQPPLIVGDPLFDYSESVRPPALKREGEQQVSRSGGIARVYFRPLPGTAAEARAIGAMLPGARVLTRDRATEAALKQVSSPKLLHIATQGFFRPDLLPEAAGAVEGRGGELDPDDGGPRVLAYSENPLLRSGLALAGANVGRSEGGEDGILTALEVAGLDLWGTKLVVLSACETGVGKVETGEGVFGMRRALMLAGSESQVMSLWQISDEVTKDLMISYYKRLLAGEGRSEALRHVQLEMLRSEGQHDHIHPYYWAAFIQSGDWRIMRLQPDPSPR